MTTLQGIMNAIRTRFHQEVELELDPAVAIQYDGVPLDTSSLTEFIRFTIIPGDQERRDIGASPVRYRQVGIAVAQVFTPIGRGDGRSLELCDAIIAAFRSVTKDGVTYRSPTAPTRVGVSGRFWQVNVSVSWFADLLA